MADVLTIRESAARAKDEGYPVSEYTIRKWVNAGAIQVRKVGRKSLVYYPNLLRYLRCEDGGDNPAATVAASGIRPVDIR